MIKIISSIFRSAWEGISKNEDVVSFVRHHPKIFSFLKKRFDRKSFYGLPLTILSVIFFYTLLLLFGIVEDFLTSDPIVYVDVRLNNLLHAFRNPFWVKAFLFITLLGKMQIITIGLVVVGVVLYKHKEKLYIFGMLGSVAVSSMIVFVGKYIFNRPRPDFPVYFESSASFPSGHAAVSLAFYGFVAYVLVRSSQTRRLRIFWVLKLIVLSGLIGLSRMYLGVHYLSDVISGYLVGFLCLVSAISLVEWKKSSNIGGAASPPSVKTAYAGAVVFLVFFLSFGALYHPNLLLEKQTGSNTIARPDPASLFESSSLPRTTETLTGTAQEPISLIIVAAGDQEFVAAWEKAGWVKADQPNFRSMYRLAKAAVTNQEYLAAPMTPSFWNAQVHDFGFERSTEKNTVRERHHARFWKSGYLALDGKSIYVGTASLDQGIKWLITHTISPDIDSERNFVVANLRDAGIVESARAVKMVMPVLGQNFSGDPFFTDGEADVIILK